MPERVTDDLDVLLHDDDAHVAALKLRDAGFTHQGPKSIGCDRWISPADFPIDVLFGRANWVKDALAEARTNPDGQGLPVLPLPHLVLMKFVASRAQDVADIARMLGQATEEQLGQVRAAFARWLPGEDEDLESLILLGQLEYQNS